MSDGPTERGRDGGAVVAVRVQDLAHGAGQCVVVRRWPLATLVAYLFEGRECDDVRAVLAAGEAVARGSRLTWPPLALSADELSAIERTFPRPRPDRPLELAAASAAVLHVPLSLADDPGGASPGALASPREPLALGRDDAVVRALAARASYVRFDYGPWADVYSAPLALDEVAALLDAARTPTSMDADLELHVVRHAATAPRLDVVVPRADARAPWRELPP